VKKGQWQHGKKEKGQIGFKVNNIKIE